MYLLHNELTSKDLTKRILAKYPQTSRATTVYQEPIHLCGKIVRKFVSRGDTPSLVIAGCPENES